MQFDSKACAEYVKMLVCHDEVEAALLVINNIPAYYRDYCPQELVDLKKTILGKIMTPHAYANGEHDSHVNLEGAIDAFKSVRATILKKEVEIYNDKGKTPHIVDMGPGEYFVPLGLAHFGLRFTYKEIGLNQKARALAEPHIKAFLKERAAPEQPEIFIANELIEHLSDTNQITIEALRHCAKEPERVHLSTPCYVYDLKRDFADITDLPHLRAYTPAEFIKAGHGLFPGYDFQLYNGMIMSLRAMHKFAIDPKPLL